MIFFLSIFPSKYLLVYEIIILGYRKPPPLKYLTSLECGAPQPSVQTPWTPLAASPVIEETFKKIVQQQKGKVTIILLSYKTRTLCSRDSNANVACKKNRKEWLLEENWISMTFFEGLLNFWLTDFLLWFNLLKRYNLYYAFAIYVRFFLYKKN